MDLSAAPREPDGAEGRDAEILSRALRLLGAREHTRLELARKLAARGFERAEVESVLDRLAASGALSRRSRRVGRASAPGAARPSRQEAL